MELLAVPCLEAEGVPILHVVEFTPNRLLWRLFWFDGLLDLLQDFECTPAFEVRFAGGTPACGGTGIASHVFQPDLPAENVYR